MKAEAATRVTSPTLHTTVFMAVAAFTTVLAISFIFKVEVVARGSGRIIPVSRVQVIQPEFPGKISEIRVKNGSLVKRGDVLIKFDPVDASANLAKVQAERDRLIIESSRIQATLSAISANTQGSEILNEAQNSFRVPSPLGKTAFFRAQNNLIKAEISDFLASIHHQDARIEITRKSEAVIHGRVVKLMADYKIQKKRLEISAQLFERGVESQSNFLDVRQTYLDIENQVEIYRQEIEQKKSEHVALAIERAQLLKGQQRTLLSRQADITAQLADLTEQERLAGRKVDATVLVAPVAGKIDKVKVFTVGGVVSAGAKLMSIVPLGGKIEVQALFPNQDIGFMEIGQKANIRLDAYPSERFGFLEGLVTDISADSSEETKGKWGYVVRVRLETSTLKTAGKVLSLAPGMTCTVDVVTESRSIISYFFAPIIKTIENSMGEH